MNHTKAKLSAETIVKELLKVTESPAVKTGAISRQTRETLQKKVLDHLKEWFNIGRNEGLDEGYRRGYQDRANQDKAEEKK